MTKEAAIQRFFNQFLPAYEENTVPDWAEMPYITYNLVTGDILSGENRLSFSLWYKANSWTAINEKTREIGNIIGLGGTTLKCDGGVIWLKKGTPFAQSMGDADNDTIRRKYINITAEYLTAD
jgi:hypothetical protein